MTKILRNEDERGTFPASALLGPLSDIEGAVRSAMIERGETSKDDPEQAEKVKAKVADLRKAIVEMSIARQNKDESLEEKQNIVRSYFTDKFLEAVDSLGVRTHVDNVEVLLNPGSLVFDLYVNTYRPPQAPLALALHQSKVQKMAADMEKSEIPITDDILNVIRKPLEDEKLWLSMNLTGRIKVDGQTKYLTLNSAAAAFYPKTMNAVLQLFDMGVFDDEEGTQEPAEKTS